MDGDRQRELRNRVRAARGYAGLSGPALATELGVSKETIKRMESGARPVDRLREIAHICGLPYEFFSVDFRRLPELADAQSDQELTLEERLAALEGLVGRLVAAKSEPSSEVIVASPPAQGGQLR